MNSPLPKHFSPSGARGPLAARAARADFPTPFALRSALLAGCAAALAIAFAFGRPDAGLVADAELAFLLRGMATLKASMVLAAVALVGWRFGRPVALRTAAVYVIGTAALAGASLLIWRLSAIPMAALVFHLAGFAVLLAAWRDEALERLRTLPAHLAGADRAAVPCGDAQNPRDLVRPVDPTNAAREARALEPA